MEPLGLAAGLAAGIIFGFVLANLLGRADREGLILRGKAEGEKERAALSERLNAREARLAEFSGDRDQQRDLAERLREETAILRGAQQEIDDRIAQVSRAAEEKAALAVEAERRTGEASRAALREKATDLENRLAATMAERERAKAELDAARNENSLLKAFQAEVDTRMEETRRLAAQKLDEARQTQQVLLADLRAASAGLLEQSARNFAETAGQAVQALRDSLQAAPSAPSAQALPLPAIPSAADATVREAGRSVCERLTIYTHEVRGLRDSLDAAVRSFNRTAAALDSGLLPAARDLRAASQSATAEPAAVEPIYTDLQALGQSTASAPAAPPVPAPSAPDSFPASPGNHSHF